MLTPHQRTKGRGVFRATVLTVLIFDDNRDAAESLVDLLQLYGHEAWTAYHHEAALTVGPADVVILEFRLPITNVWNLVRRLWEREIDEYPRYSPSRPAVTSATSVAPARRAPSALSSSPCPPPN